MTTGRFRHWFWAGLLARGGRLYGPLVRPDPPAPSRILGLGFYEHAYVQAGQAVPLA